MAPGIGWLIAARAVEAVGGTMLNPVALAVVITFPAPADRARAVGVFGSMSGLALALGPILGDSLGWRAVFWVNVPIIAVTIAATVAFVPESRAARAWLGPSTPLPLVLADYLLFGVFLGTVNPPITNSAVSGRQTGIPRASHSVPVAALSTGPHAKATATRAATLFAEVEGVSLRRPTG